MTIREKDEVSIAGILSLKEAKEVAKDAGVTVRTVARLITGGVALNDVLEVIDFRDSLMTMSPKGRVTGQVTVDAILSVYHVAEGDMQILELIVDRTEKIVAVNRLSRDPRTSDFNNALYQAAEQYAYHGIDFE